MNQISFNVINLLNHFYFPALHTKKNNIFPCEPWGSQFAFLSLRPSLSPPFALFSLLLLLSGSAFKKGRERKRERERERERGVVQAEAANLRLQLCARVWLCVSALVKVWVRAWERKRSRRSAERDLADLSVAFMSRFCPADLTSCLSVWKITWKKKWNIRELRCVKQVEQQPSCCSSRRQDWGRTEGENDWIF